MKKIARLVAFSDSHSYIPNIKKLFEKQPDADKYVFLGDGNSELEKFLNANPEYTAKTVRVKGNCDYDSNVPKFEVFEMEGHRIFAAHGHTFGVSGGYDNIIEAAKQNDCDMILHGHTHVRFAERVDGIFIMNPGSIAIPRDGKKPSFGIIDFFEDNSFMYNISDI